MIDPVSIIVGALAAGATAGGQKVASQAIQDAYKGLKELVLSKVKDNPKAEMVMANHADDPDTWEKPLQKAIVENHIDQDPQIVHAAQNFLTLVQGNEITTSKYNVKIKDSQGFNIGDHGQVTITNVDKPEKKSRR